MKKIISLFLALTLVLGLSGCSANEQAVFAYERGDYEKALERFEALGDANYMRKCRFMLLYEYILEKGDAAEDGNYTIYSSCLSDFAYTYLYANPKNRGEIQVDFTISEDAGDAVNNYEIFLTLSVDDPKSTYQITQSAEHNDGEIVLTICDGTVDVSSYTSGIELNYAQCQRTTIGSEAPSTSNNVNRTTRKELFTYFGVAIDGLYETLIELDIDITTKDLGFDAWQYITTQ